jgi:hypothetical protein
MKTLEGQTIFDIAVQQCGSADAAFALAVLNGVSLTDDLIPGKELALPEVVNADVALYFKSKNLQPATSLAAQAQIIGSLVDTVANNSQLNGNMIRVMESQTLLDIALQEFGSIEAAFALATLNGMSPTDELTAGELLHRTAIVNKKIVSYYSEKNIRPATGSIISTLGGVGYWAIETEFLVS